jgi:putative membrane protein
MKSKLNKLVPFLMLSLFVWTGCRDNDPEPNTLTSQEFMQRAAASDVFEIQTGQMATQEAQTQEVQQFGQQLVADHTQSSTMLRNLADQKNIALPDSMNQEQMVIRNNLRNQSGVAFDREFINAQVQAHEEAVDLYEQATREVTDQDVRGFAQQVLPKLQQHLDLARQLKTMTDQL